MIILQIQDLKKSEISGFIFHVMNGLDLKNAYKYSYLKGSDIVQFRKQAEIKINDFRKLKQYGIEFDV